MFALKLFKKHSLYKEASFTKKRITHKDIVPIIFKHKPLFEIEKQGKSFEKREIYSLKIGFGKTKVLLWSQMHGNESTATQAIFDILNFFSNPQNLQQEADNILKKCTLYFLPMLNPDGAENYTRRNAQGIDINRDALRLEAYESKILMNIRDKINAEFGFNLHDQDVWYSAGDTKFPASISFLAPAYNFEKRINNTRKKSMQLIVSMFEMLQEFIPNQVAKYDDAFMPNAFGDNIQKKGTSTILIESGGYRNDIEKQFIRKLNFVSILHSLKNISEQSFQNENLEKYENIPYNKKNKFFDYLIRNAVIIGKFGKYNADIGIRHKAEKTKDVYIIDDIGDLSYNFGFEEIDLKSKCEIIASIKENAEAIISHFF